LVSSREVKEVIGNPTLVRDGDKWSNQKLLDAHNTIHGWSGREGYWKRKPKDLTIAQCEKFHDLLVEQFWVRGIEGPDHRTPIHVLPRGEAEEGKILGPLIWLVDVLPYFESFSVEDGDATNIWLAGSLVNNGATLGDLDVFVEGDRRGRGNSEVEEAIKNLFLNPSLPLPPQPEFARRLHINFTIPKNGYAIKIFKPSFEAVYPTRGLREIAEGVVEEGIVLECVLEEVEGREEISEVKQEVLQPIVFKPEISITTPPQTINFEPKIEVETVPPLIEVRSDVKPVIKVPPSKVVVAFPRKIKTEKKITLDEKGETQIEEGTAEVVEA